MTMFPLVPKVPGVPALARNASNSITGLAKSIVGVIGSLTGDFDFLSSDGPGVSSLTEAPRWGLFDEGGTQIIVPDSFLGLDSLKEYRVSDYPIEEGGFESYNKVEVPFVGKILFAKGGDEAERTQFLSQIEQAIKSLDVYSLVTPEKSYASVNVTHRDYRRTVNNGVTMLTVEVWVEEIRNTVTASFSNTQAPEGAATVNDGGVQPQTPSPAIQQAVARERAIT